MFNVLKVRLYPNKEQEVALVKSFGCCRLVWNYYLEKTNNQYKETGKGLNYCEMAKDLTQLKKLPDYLFLQEATAATLQQSLKNLESAFKNFFQKRARFPKFKSKHKKQSIRYPESCSIKGNGVKLPKAQRLRRRQQSLSRKTKGSNNRKKQVKRVAKVHEKIANTRQDFLHKISRKLVDENQVIVVENLCIKGLARTKLAKSVLDAIRVGCWIWDVAQFPGLQTGKRRWEVN